MPTTVSPTYRKFCQEQVAKLTDLAEKQEAKAKAESEYAVSMRSTARLLRESARDFARHA